MADQTIFQMSQKSDFLEQPFLKKDLVYVSDNNSSSTYNGQIIIETSSLANSGKWISLSESFITVPYVVQLASSTDITAIQSPMQVSLKSGSWNLIHSFSVDYNGSTIVQQTPFQNFFCSFKAITSWAQEDLLKYGNLVNFWPDSPDSICYIPAGGVASTLGGIGFTNNQITPLSISLSTGAAITTQPLIAQANGNVFRQNDGLWNRVKNTQIISTTDGNAVQAAAFNPILITLQNLQNQLGCQAYSWSGAAAAARYNYAFMAVIRLKDLHDFFSQVPLIKGAFLKLTLNYNAGIMSYTMQAAAAQTHMTAASYVATYGQTCPFNTLSHCANHPFNSVAAFNGAVLTYTSGVRSVGSGATLFDWGVNCRLYATLYTMSPSYEQQYLSMSPTKEIVYRDIFNYVVYGASVGQIYNQLLTNGISAPKSLVVIPICSGALAASGYHTTSGTALQPFQSSFTSEPASPSPCGFLYNFNVQVSGINIFQQNEQYDFEQFTDQLVSINAVNGGKTTGLSSGLLGRSDFQKLYRYYVVDLSRGYAADDYIPKSILIQATNYSTKILDLYCFIEYQKKVTVDVATGAILKME